MTAVFRQGDTGPAVIEIRDRLQRLGLLSGEFTDEGNTDLFGEDVTAAVRQFQQSRGLEVDGLVGAHTFRRLEEARWQLGDRVLAYHPRHLMRGEDVATLQQRLSQLGFDSGRVDGIFGHLTDAALREFQGSVGVVPDGTCGPDSFRALARLARTMGGTGSGADLRERTQFNLTAGLPLGKVVVLDPEHEEAVPAALATHSALGAFDAGALTDDLASRVEGRLAAIGVQVLLTHAPGTRPTTDEAARADFSNRMSADLMVSLHLERNPDPRANGVATFYYGDAVTGTGSILGARAAALVQEELTTRTDLTNCRIHAKSWDLLRLTRMPAVHVECGYATSPYDAVRLADPAFRDALADGLATAVVRYFAPDEGSSSS